MLYMEAMYFSIENNLLLTDKAWVLHFIFKILDYVHRRIPEGVLIIFIFTSWVNFLMLIQPVYDIDFFI